MISSLQFIVSEPEAHNSEKHKSYSKNITC